MSSSPTLYIFSGLPGVGKTTLAKILAKNLNAVYLRIDTIEQGIRELCDYNVQGEGYRLAYRIAEDNLKIGNNVVSDQCNPANFVRKEWNAVAIKNHCKYLNIEVICSDKTEHKKRTTSPVWKEIIRRKQDKTYSMYYEPWEEEHIIIDTANKSVEECVKELMKKTEL
jgi:predicted kinase